MNYELTIPQLCAVKREQMGLTKGQAMRGTQYTNYHAFEKGKANPRPNMLAKIMDFYKITNEELNKCKTYTKENAIIANTNSTIKSIIKDTDDLLRRVEAIEIKGHLGKLMIEEAQKTLSDVIAKVSEIEIIDELLK